MVGKVIVAKVIGINILYIRIIHFVINGKKRVKRREIKKEIIIFFPISCIYYTFAMGSVFLI